MSSFQKLPEEVRRQQILDAALRAFSRDGYDKTSMARIARDAGLTKGGVYFHFSSKEELFTATVEAELTRRWGTLQELSEASRNVPSALALQQVIQWWFRGDDGPRLLTPGILAACIDMDRPREAFVEPSTGSTITTGASASPVTPLSSDSTATPAAPSTSRQASSAATSKAY